MQGTDSGGMLGYMAKSWLRELKGKDISSQKLDREFAQHQMQGHQQLGMNPQEPWKSSLKIG